MGFHSAYTTRDPTILHSLISHKAAHGKIICSTIVPGFAVRSFSVSSFRLCGFVRLFYGSAWLRALFRSVHRPQWSSRSSPGSAPLTTTNCLGPVRSGFHAHFLSVDSVPSFMADVSLWLAADLVGRGIVPRSALHPHPFVRSCCIPRCSTAFRGVLTLIRVRCTRRASCALLLIYATGWESRSFHIFVCMYGSFTGSCLWQLAKIPCSSGRDGFISPGLHFPSLVLLLSS